MKYLILGLLSGVLSGCATFGQQCENQGYAQGSAGYAQCVAYKQQQLDLFAYGYMMRATQPTPRPITTNCSNGPNGSFTCTSY